MFKRVAHGFQVVLGLVFLLGLAAAIGWVFYTSVTKAPAVVAAVVTGFAALFGVFVQRYLEHQREDERSRRERMSPIYEKLVRFFQRGEPGPDDGKDIEDFFGDLTQGLLLWGSPAIVRAFVDWRRAAVGLAEDDPKVMFLGERLLFAVRSDLGQSNEGLDTGDLLRVYINDVDDYLTDAHDDGFGRDAAADLSRPRAA